MCDLLISNFNIVTRLSRHTDSSSMLLFHETTEYCPSPVLYLSGAFTHKCAVVRGNSGSAAVSTYRAVSFLVHQGYPIFNVAQ